MQLSFLSLQIDLPLVLVYLHVGISERTADLLGDGVRYVIFQLHWALYEHRNTA